MNADCILYLIWIAISKIEAGVEVTYCTFAVATKSERIGHESGTIFPKVEGMLPSMWEFRAAVGNNHLGYGQSPEQRANIAVIVVRNVVQDNTFPIIEANVELLLACDSISGVP